ncbi:MAG: nitrous oxide reductase family maturation protein NosD [Paracoccus sp. (in: a-proteobacteria)]|uniref:nitrous oxide reductase family maturation protein NosD n=1 Tax=Paracoccus sp. TaxID=267 RepID=UPI0026DEA7A1|nr:nitrous oxide reductase family maturation protein NosD [Paracoccus sp. (in: a-proteobacteria)]MDO5622505.1 nitrous oxide reductase family maturation protein NosD [Paracoccus sp. (in: a-proteobacteria)]
MRRVLALVLALSGGPLWAANIDVPAGGDALKTAIAGSAPGDVLRLAAGLHHGPVTIDHPLTLQGQEGAQIDGGGQGSVITITAEDVTVRDLLITGSGPSHQNIDSGVMLTRTARAGLIENNRFENNLFGVDVHGAHDTIVRGNTIIGGRDFRMNNRGNGVYVWNAPGAQVVGNTIRYGRDGIFTNSSRRNVFKDNLMYDLRFAVHYMYTHDSEVSENISVGNHLGFALMFSDRLQVLNNISVNDRDHGVMLNYANSSDVAGNLVAGPMTGGPEKCTFIYNAHRNLLVNNRFEGCDIGIHFTAGSERNGLTGNAFIGNRTQVKYVGTRDIEWSVEGRGNYWSDHPVFDLNGDGIADSRFRPNDLMDHILWSQPAAALLTGSPAVQMVRWSQANFPATMPGGVVDSFPLTQPVTIALPDEIAQMAQKMPLWATQRTDDDGADALAPH